MGVPTLANPGTTVTKPISLAHVVLKTTAQKFPTMVSFYKTFLSATPSFESATFALLAYDAEHHRIGIAALPGTTEPSPASSGLSHVAFTFASLTDLAMSYLQRKENGMVPVWCVNHGPTTSMYYKDPDGNVLETQVDNFETAEEATEFMKGESFERNPIGSDFDPEELVRRLKDGEDEGVIKSRVEVGERMDVPL